MASWVSDEKKGKREENLWPRGNGGRADGGEIVVVCSAVNLSPLTFLPQNVIFHVRSLDLVCALVVVIYQVGPGFIRTLKPLRILSFPLVCQSTTFRRHKSLEARCEKMYEVAMDDATDMVGKKKNCSRLVMQGSRFANKCWPRGD